jgi:hypothetical protein
MEDRNEGDRRKKEYKVAPLDMLLFSYPARFRGRALEGYIGKKKRWLRWRCCCFTRPARIRGGVLERSPDVAQTALPNVEPHSLNRHSPGQ